MSEHQLAVCNIGNLSSEVLHEVLAVDSSSFSYDGYMLILEHGKPPVTGKPPHGT